MREPTRSEHAVFVSTGDASLLADALSYYLDHVDNSLAFRAEQAEDLRDSFSKMASDKTHDQP